MGIFKSVHRMMLKRMKPLEYARLVGVNFEGGYTYTDMLNGVANLG